MSPQASLHYSTNDPANLTRGFKPQHVQSEASQVDWIDRCTNVFSRFCPKPQRTRKVEWRWVKILGLFSGVVYTVCPRMGHLVVNLSDWSIYFSEWFFTFSPTRSSSEHVFSFLSYDFPQFSHGIQDGISCNNTISPEYYTYKIYKYYPLRNSHIHGFNTGEDLMRGNKTKYIKISTILKMGPYACD